MHQKIKEASVEYEKAIYAYSTFGVSIVNISPICHFFRIGCHSFSYKI
jgi:hypothetical protein